MIESLTGADLGRILSLNEFEPLARARMAPDAFDYVAGGAWDELSLAEDVAAWQRYRFRPRVLTGASRPELTGRFLGRPSALPVAVAPMAFQILAHPDGESAMARAAAAAGVPFCLSTSSSTPLETVAAAVPDSERWFQLYNVHDLAATRSLVDRAAMAGYRAIVLTVDLPVLGYRPRDRRSGFVVPPMVNLDPAHDRPGGIDHHGSFVLSWADVATIRSWSDLPLVLKGILTAEDATLAVEAGVDAIVVSNHGARQLDRTVTSADALEGVVAAVGGTIEIWVDGGLRGGLDILVALALGATGVLLGRPLYWALAAGGQPGVERALAIVADELAVAMPLLGIGRLAEIERAHLG